MDSNIIESHLERIREMNRQRIGEQKERIPKRIARLKEAISIQSPNLKQHPSTFDNEVYLRCLRACAYKIEKSATLYIKFCSLRHENLKGIREYSIPSVHMDQVYGQKLYSVLKPRDALGRQILLIRGERWDPTTVSSAQIVGAKMNILDEMLTSEDTQLNGIVIISDNKGFSFSHAKVSTKEGLLATVKIIQDSFPANIAEFHMINAPVAFNLVFPIMKAFMNDACKKKIFLHSNFESLHKHLHPSILPEFLGGKWSESDYADMEIIKSLRTKDNYYKEFLKYGQTTDDEA